MQDGDFNFIISSWLKTYKYSGPLVKRMRDRDYYETYEPIVKRMIAKSDMFIACQREEPDIIVGFLAIERHKEHDVIHFTLVKDLWQKIGVGKYLLTAAEPKMKTYFTHWTSPMESLSHKFPQFTFNPFLIPL